MKILLAFDKEIDIPKDKVITFLNSKCKFLNFELSDKILEFGTDVLSKPTSFKKVKDQLLNLIGNFDRVFCFTDNPYDDNFFFHEYNMISIYSFYGWSYLTNLPKSNGLLYLVIDYLALSVDKTGFRHNSETGCIYDFLWSKGGIDDGMRQAKVCPTCLERINSQISSELQIGIISDLKILMNELANASKWNQDILNNIQMKNKKKKIPKRNPKTEGEIHAVIASPGDTSQVRQLILDRLEIQFRRGNHEAHCNKRLIIHGWEDLASQNGYAQDIINEKIISKMDIVIAIFKHKLGTPTHDQLTGIQRAESGTAEELLQALDTSNLEHPIAMTYFFSKAPVISLDSPDKEKIEDNWMKLKEFKKKIQNQVIYKPYTDENELLQIILSDLEKNIIDFYE